MDKTFAEMSDSEIADSLDAVGALLDDRTSRKALFREAAGRLRDRPAPTPALAPPVFLADPIPDDGEAIEVTADCPDFAEILRVDEVGTRRPCLCVGFDAMPAFIATLQAAADWHARRTGGAS